MSDKVTTSDEKEIEEKRIRPTVIRRRAKVVETPPEEIAVAKPADTELSVTEEAPAAEEVTVPESAKVSEEVSGKIEPQAEATLEEKPAKPEVEQSQNFY